MPRRSEAFLWRKLDGLGLDSCRLARLPHGWRLSGMAVFLEPPRVCHLAYDVLADVAFRTKNARVTGCLGNKAIDVRCESSRTGEWRIDGVVDRRLTGCVDVDFGFTPATNLFAIRRLALNIGESGDARAAFLNLPRCRFSTLQQRYERVGETEYSYAAPTFGFAAILEVSSVGAVRSYPGLFELVARRHRASRITSVFP